MRLQRRTVGTHFSEGARQTWAAIDRKGWSHAQLAEAIGKSQSLVHRWLYGDALPDLLSVIKIEKLLRVRCLLWAMPAKNHFIPPAARAA